jgi:hypothetical protein
MRRTHYHRLTTWDYIDDMSTGDALVAMGNCDTCGQYVSCYSLDDEWRKHWTQWEPLVIEEEVFA